MSCYLHHFLHSFMSILKFMIIALVQNIIYINNLFDITFLYYPKHIEFGTVFLSLFVTLLIELITKGNLNLFFLSTKEDMRARTRIKIMIFVYLSVFMLKLAEWLLCAWGFVVVVMILSPPPLLLFVCIP